MEIYIRSQDKLQLEKMERIVFTPFSEFDYSTGSSTDTNEGIIFVNTHEFGKYTREQALDIINEIKTIIEPTIFYGQQSTPHSVEELQRSIISDYFTLENKSFMQQVDTVIYELPPAIQKDKE